MLVVQKKLAGAKSELVVSFDLEWTKNYRVSSGNRPFCFSFVYFIPPVDLLTVEDNLEFGFVSQYIEDESEIPQLVEDADTILGDFMEYRLLLVGHQLCSDLGVLLNQGRHSPNIHTLRCAWRNREKMKKGPLAIFDTRYDVASFLQGKSRRLVDVCLECNLEVTQPEITSSMTKMQGVFYSTGDARIMERLSVLNLRHSLSAALVYFYFMNDCRPTDSVNVNQVLYNNLKPYFDYIRSEEFEELT